MKLQDIIILCVDDSRMVHKFLHTLLRKDYKNIYFASDGVEGVAAYKKYHPHIVISDINMPKMNGLEMVRKIKKINPKATIVMMSTESGKNFIMKAAEEGVSGYVSKNDARDEMKPTIDKLAKLLLKQKATPSQSNPYAHLQAFLELNNEMSLLSDGTNIFSCNKLFLDFLGIHSVKDFIASYASVEYLVESVVGVSEKDFNSGHWIKYLLSEPKGREVTIAEKAKKMIAKVVKIADKNELYAIIFSEKREKQQLEKNIEIFNANTLTLSREYFEQQLPVFSQSSKEYGVPVSLISLRIADIEVKGYLPKTLANIVTILHQSSEARDLIYSYEKGFVIICINSDIDATKSKAKKIADTLKTYFSPNRVRAKLGFISLDSSNYAKTVDYLEKFYEAKLSPS